jgi:formamidopyrimidine-DNA glycosylase
MPELPEVETIKNFLRPRMIGHTFTEVRLVSPELVRQPKPSEFCQALPGQTIEEISRRGKYFLFSLSNRQTLIVHLKMSGFLLLQPELTSPNAYVRAIFWLEDKTELHFCDPRKFGSLWLVEDESKVIGHLGLEPLEDDFTPQLLYQLLQQHHLPIKAFLVDQNIIAGIGNMYADEALFASGIHPLRKTKELALDEAKALHQAIRGRLTEGIKYGGASVDTYRHPDGKLGRAHSHFKVAHRGGQSCEKCHTPISRIEIRNRGSYFCPHCQPETAQLTLPISISC